jgi:ribose/xylose/arabinose/galactoside ABC-type transport system permease subunit
LKSLDGQLGHAQRIVEDVMSETLDASVHATPRHLWVVGVIALLWNAVGALDFVMTQTKNEAYMSSFTPEQLEFFYGFPAWVVAAWAVAVWGGVIGSVLLLLRKRFAVQLFLVSLAVMVITTIQNYVLSDGFEIIGDTFTLVFTAAIFLAAVALFLYARAML